jgi:DNA-binding response OmpR family regulator
MMSMNKILLFSADDSLSTSITTALVQAGYKVIQASSGIGSIDLIQAEHPAAVILDIVLPDFSSLAIIRTIRSSATFDRLPVILVGSGLKEEDVLIGLEVGADLCLLEAFHPQVFIARLRSLLRRYETIPLHY